MRSPWISRRRHKAELAAQKARLDIAWARRLADAVRTANLERDIANQAVAHWKRLLEQTAQRAKEKRR